MYKILIILAVLLGSCCQPNQKRLPTKVEYLRIGFENGKETYLQVQGTGLYEIKYDDELHMQVVEDPAQSCSGKATDMIAADVNFFSVVSEHEYNIKNLGVEATPVTPTPEYQ